MWFFSEVTEEVATAEEGNKFVEAFDADPEGNVEAKLLMLLLLLMLL